MKFSLRALLVATAIIALAFATLLAIEQTIVGRARVSRRIESRLGSMSATTPSGLTQQQWQVMVDWTRNLHGSSLLPFQTSLAEIETFERQLNEQLDESVDATTIEWIWDHYARACDGGDRYQRFRLQVNETLTAMNSPILLEPPELDDDGG